MINDEVVLLVISWKRATVYDVFFSFYLREIFNYLVHLANILIDFYIILLSFINIYIYCGKYIFVDKRHYEKEHTATSYIYECGGSF